MACFLHNRILEGVPWAMTQQKGEWHEGAQLDRQIPYCWQRALCRAGHPKETIITRYIGTKISKNKAHAHWRKGMPICSLNDRYDIDGNTLKPSPLYQSFL